MKLEIEGNLSKREIQEILKKIREIEQRDPDNKYIAIFLIDESMTLKETIKIVTSIFPDRKEAM